MMNKKATNPASSGPAGPHFEGQVGAHYLLTLLAGAVPRGLPGTIIDSVEFQRAGEGYPLDDVIVHAHDAKGVKAVLEIQVKRSISFTPTDSIFKSVVTQIAEASQKPDFDSIKYELAIATAKTSKKIDGAYQEVLTWARQLGNSATFFERLNRKRSASEDMRTFVSSFRLNLSAAGAPYDDETVWKLLRRLQILVFDFTAEGSSSEALANERAIRVLHPDEVVRASDLWTSLIELSIQIAASGGDRDKVRLVNELTEKTFRFSGEKSYATAREAVEEASQFALADITDQIGEVKLTRYERVNAVNNALDHGRYVEILGDAGVGKSAILKHFAEQVCEEAIPIVFSSKRISLRGWTAMRSEIGFDGTARELLTDFAANGGAIIFIDSLDFFSEEEKLTINDLVREAAKVPGISVIVTARRDFGIEEPNWLHSSSLSALGIAPSVIIEELTENELDELSNAAPSLSSLLTDTHPARDVARNLFRLSRLAMQSSDAHLLRTEVEMANQWWRSADGSMDGNHRERARVLRQIAQQVLFEIDPLDVSELPTSAIDTLVASGTLLDLQNDKVMFRHDVLREWAVACLIGTDLSVLQNLPLKRPVSPTFARATELLSRILIEQGSDLTEWQSLLSVMSDREVHGSWRRAVLLALVRAENAPLLLTQTSSLLFADKAKLLRELIRLVMAVDVMPISKALTSSGIDTSLLPEDLNVPSGSSWLRLVYWLHHTQEHLPKVVIPDVVDLYINWSLGTFGKDPSTPKLVRDLYNWLKEIEDTNEHISWRDFRQPFNGELDYDQVRKLEGNLRQGFLLSCNHTPDLAAQYLQELKERDRNREAVGSILKFRGTLTQAAPVELAELTLTALLPDENPEEDEYEEDLRKPFDYIDHDFIPASPAQGPFLELLTYAPEHGKTVIHKLVDHAIKFYSKGRDYGENAIKIVFPEGERIFPWIDSYSWSRGSVDSYSVTSGLMALEAWAHQRIEAGEPFDKVLMDILGPSGSPCCYLLVAVDLILSHFPKSKENAIPYLACPKLLCIDRERAGHDQLPIPDFYGLRELQKEPAGVINLESLQKRPSRRNMLDQLLGYYTHNKPFHHRDKLCEMLQAASTCLEPPDKNSDLRNPDFMSVYALNVLDPENYKKIKITLEDGTEKEAYEYISPETEKKHFAVLNKADEANKYDTNIQLQLSMVVEDPLRSSAEFAAAAVEWANGSMEEAKDNDSDKSMRAQAKVTAAMVAMRDGDSELRNSCAAWAYKVFMEALDADEDSVHRFRGGVRFNSCAIAFVGVVHALKESVSGFEASDILKFASRGNPAPAHGLKDTASKLIDIDERLLPALLRIAIKLCIKTHIKWDASDKVREEYRLKRLKISEEALNAELNWLANNSLELEWPTVPSLEIHRRRGIRLSKDYSIDETPEVTKDDPDEYFDHQAAALWLRALHDIAASDNYTWIYTIINKYNKWTAEANGFGLEANDEVDNEPSEWNDSYYYLLAYSLKGLKPVEVDNLALNHICALPDDSFFDVITIFISGVDDLFFNKSALTEDCAKHIRSKLAERMMCCSGWKRMSGSRKDSIEIKIAPAIATLLFNEYGITRSPKCYLLEKGIEQFTPFLETVKNLAEDNPSIFIAMAILNLFEVSPRVTHLPFIISIAKSWYESFNDFSEFWVDHGIGQRFCKLIQIVLNEDSDALSNSDILRADLDYIISGLISLGVPEAKQLEEII